ncbi:MAG TPA: hypothetical protein VIK78_17380 [Ruminiclostridium sp.]
MNDFQEGSDNFNNSIDNSNPPPSKNPNTVLDVFMGIGISAIAYALTWFVFRGQYNAMITVLIDFIIIAAFGFLTVRFFRTNHKVSAIIMLALISPVILNLLLLGACGLILLPK